MKTAIIGMVYILMTLFFLLIFLFHQDLRIQIIALGGLLYIKNPMFEILDSVEWKENKIVKKLGMAPEE